MVITNPFKKSEPTRAERQRQKYERWRAGLDRYRSAIDSLESSKAEADAILGEAVAEAVETGTVTITDELREAASTVRTCTVLLERLGPLERAERLRDVSPTPRRRMRPVKINTDSEGTDFGGVMGGMYEAVPETEG